MVIASRTQLHGPVAGLQSVAEQGVPGLQLTAWNALLAPKGAPPAVVHLLNTEVRKILANPDTRQRLSALGFEVAGTTPVFVT